MPYMKRSKKSRTPKHSTKRRTPKRSTKARPPKRSTKRRTPKRSNKARTPKRSTKLRRKMKGGTLGYVKSLENQIAGRSVVNTSERCKSQNRSNFC